MSLDFKSVLVCDDIRREDNGKLFFLGVYPNDIYPHKFPATLRLAIWITATTKEQNNKVLFQVSVESKSGKSGLVFREEAVEINVINERFNPKGTSIFFGLAGIIVHFEGDSELVVKAKPEGGRWKKIASMPVILRSADTT